MHDGTALLDRVFFLIGQEEAAVAAEDMDTLDALVGERAKLMEAIWQQREVFDEDHLRVQMQRIKERHEKLTAAARALEPKFREQQKNGRMQSRYFNTDRRIHAEMQKAFYCNKVS